VRFNEKPEIWMRSLLRSRQCLRSKEGGWGIYGGDSREARDCLLFYSERESETVCDREEIFGDDEERLEIVTCMMNLNTSSQH
jgi:hypothetical protein